ncbi:MAG: hypothetical protein HC930_01830 [Hydrococcus sp. SU_1_0]|nr:hypothetical protein [Hydrococcus sp. SU_1_0]
MESTDPQLIRALLRTAYQGDKPPPVLLEAALRKFRLPRTHKQPKLLHILASILKLVLTYGTSDTTTMTQLDCTRKNSAYQCGRLLAICEEAQRRASGNINTTVVDRFYGAASTSPAAYLSLLHTRAKTSHLPQIRRKNRGYVEIEKLLQEVWVSIAELGDVPTILMPKEQAEFAIGFYCQKANFFKSSKPKTDPQQNDKGE